MAILGAEYIARILPIGLIVSIKVPYYYDNLLI
jgi:hypothetical protein